MCRAIPWRKKIPILKHLSTVFHVQQPQNIQFTNITNLCQQTNHRTTSNTPQQQLFPPTNNNSNNNNNNNNIREIQIHSQGSLVLKQQEPIKSPQDYQTPTQQQQQHQQHYFPNFHESFMSKYQESQTAERQSPSSHQTQQQQQPNPTPQPPNVQQPSHFYNSRLSDSSDDLQGDGHHSISNTHSPPTNMSYHYPRGQGVIYPSIYAPLFDNNAPRISQSPQQWSRPYPNYFAYLPNLIPPPPLNTSTASTGGGLGQEPTGAAYSYSQEASPPPQTAEMEKVPQLHLGYTPSPTMAPVPYTLHPPMFPTIEGNIKIDLYHKPRGSKGTWMQIVQNDQIRVTEGKGKRLKMIVHSESELVKIALQVQLLDSQDVANGGRRGSNQASSANSPSSSPANAQNSSTANTPFNQSNNSGSGQNASANSPPTNTQQQQSPSPSNIMQTMASSINTSPSPSSFSLSSPAQSPIQSPSQFQGNSQYTVAIAVSPPSSSPNPVLPQSMSTQLPPPDPQGLSVESVRVYRYPSSTSVALSALEFELKLAKLSKRLRIVLSALSKDGVKYEAHSVDLYAHNNGKHNANSIRKKALPYPSPTLNGYPPRDDQVAPSSPSDRPKRKPLNRSSASTSSSALIPSSPLPTPPPLPMSKSSPSIFTSTTSTTSTNQQQQQQQQHHQQQQPPHLQQNNSYNTNNSPKIKPESMSNPPLPSIPLTGAMEYPWAYPPHHHHQQPQPAVHHHLENGVHHHTGHWAPADHHGYSHHLYSMPHHPYIDEKH
ncbi:hypothetical protein DFA_03587 [Cavenderia fasciculata]|uniref:Uncharacterized protein n=1 Tax=Cavenderia fasciculata TaxID=261658 RepID=F4PI55_CACFS|nr:uncharacterized protein DFA_03587 [Cavenderia fasciculata]EGG25338.1 hypothetical protein DFA_03587 [Cavenderia fasciculata]|eukprot:XP_004363189.1 hypothetical protein DFA_03587 [Cavenderia fasciculata]